jgi:hypothetical protein
MTESPDNEPASTLNRPAIPPMSQPTTPPHMIAYGLKTTRLIGIA